MSYNLSNQYISQSFQNLMQYVTGGDLFTGTGASIASLNATASYASTASIALNVRDQFPYTGSAIISGGLTISGSLNTNDEYTFALLSNVTHAAAKTSSVNIFSATGLSHSGSYITSKFSENNISITNGMLIGSASFSVFKIPSNFAGTIASSGSNDTLQNYTGIADVRSLGGPISLLHSTKLFSTSSLGDISLEISLEKRNTDYGSIKLLRTIGGTGVRLQLDPTETAVQIVNNYSDSNAELFIVQNNSFNDILNITNSNITVSSSMAVTGSLKLTGTSTFVLPTTQASSITGSMYIDTANNLIFVFTGNGGNVGWVSASLV